VGDPTNAGRLHRYEGQVPQAGNESPCSEGEGSQDLQLAQGISSPRHEEYTLMAYLGFKKLEGKLSRKGIRNPGALAASIGRKKYGKSRFQRAASRGVSPRSM